jgi:hypothetical protein
MITDCWRTKSARAGLVRHLADDSLRRKVVAPGGAHPAPAQGVEHVSELAVLRHRDLVASALCLLRSIRAR